MEAPKAGQTWQIEYGLHETHTLYLRVLKVHEDPSVRNWRCLTIECMDGKNETMQVHGNCFIQMTHP